MGTPLLNWCQRAASDKEPNQRVQSEWAESVVPDLADRLLNADRATLSAIVDLFRVPFLKERFVHLTGNSEFKGTPGLRVYEAVQAMVEAGLGNDEAAEKFAFAMGTENLEEGRWALDAWRSARGGQAIEGERIRARLVAVDGARAQFVPIQVQRVKAPWAGPRLHPFFGAGLVCDAAFMKTVDRAYRAVLAVYPHLDQDDAFLWWPEQYPPLKGDSHGGTMAVVFASLGLKRGINADFLISCALDEANPDSLRPVTSVSKKATHCLKDRSDVQFFVHRDNFALARAAANECGARLDQVLSGTSLAELVDLAAISFSLPQTLARSESQRVFSDERRGYRITHDWADLLVEVQRPGEAPFLESGSRLFTEDRRVILEGDPGSGKSWMLRRMVALGQARFEATDDGHIPSPSQAWATVLLQASPFFAVLNGSKDPLLAVGQILSSESIQQADIVAAVRQGRIAIAIDRCEDLDFNKASELAIILSDFDRVDAMRILLAVRTGTEAAEAFDQLKWSRARMVALDETKVEEVISALTREESEIGDKVRQIGKESDLSASIDNPFLVQLMIEAVRSGANLLERGAPPSRHSLYHRYVQSRLKKIGSKGGNRVNFLADVRRFAEDASALLLDAEYRDGHPIRQIRAAWHPVQQNFGGIHLRADLENTLLESGLLIREEGKETILRFPHLTIGEYLAAAAIARRFDQFAQQSDHAGCRRLVRNLIDKPNRRQTLEFVPGFCRDPLTLIDVLLGELERTPRDGALLAAGKMIREIRIE